MAANDSAVQTGSEKISTNALVTLNGVNIATDLIEVQRVKAGFGADGDFNDVTAASPLPVTIGLTDTQLRATAVPVSGAFFQATQPVSIATNTPDVTDRAARALGTIANTAFGATLAAETTKVIGTVNVAAGQTVGLVDGTAVIGALTANQSVNTAQVNGIAPLMGNGVTGTGSQRVTIASDNTAFPVNATLTAETTKVIGTVNANAGTNLNTSALSLETTQAAVKAKTDNLDVLLSTRATEVTLAAIKAKTDNLDVLLSTRTKAADTQLSDVTDRAARLVGVVTAANLDVAISTRSTEVTLAAVKAKTDNLDVALSTVAKDASIILLDNDLKALLGSLTEYAGANTVVDLLRSLNVQLTQFAKKNTAENLALTRAIRTTPKPVPMPAKMLTDRF